MLCDGVGKFILIIQLYTLAQLSYSLLHQINVNKGNEIAFSFRTELLSLCKKEFDKASINN